MLSDGFHSFFMIKLFFESNLSLSATVFSRQPSVQRPSNLLSSSFMIILYLSATPASSLGSWKPLHDDIPVSNMSDQTFEPFIFIILHKFPLPFGNLLTGASVVWIWNTVLVWWQDCVAQPRTPLLPSC